MVIAMARVWSQLTNIQRLRVADTSGVLLSGVRRNPHRSSWFKEIGSVETCLGLYFSLLDFLLWQVLSAVVVSTVPHRFRNCALFYRFTRLPCDLHLSKKSSKFLLYYRLVIKIELASHPFNLIPFKDVSPFFTLASVGYMDNYTRMKLQVVEISNELICFLA